MLSFVLGLLQGLIGFFNAVLPTSPFSGFLQGAEGLQLGLGWLNWIVPVGDLILIFGGWLTVLLTWTALDWALGAAGKSVLGTVAG